MLNISTFIEKDSPCLTYERERERERERVQGIFCHDHLPFSLCIFPKLYKPLECSVTLLSGGRNL